MSKLMNDELFEAFKTALALVPSRDLLLPHEAAAVRLAGAYVLASEPSNFELDGVEQIADERFEQLNKHGRSEEHDEAHVRSELAYAAMVLAMPPGERHNMAEFVRDCWPFDDYEIPVDRRKQLVVAGALIAAEIDRLDRIEAQNA